MGKFTCPVCGCHEIEEYMECEGMVTPISLENDEPEYNKEGVYGCGDVYNVSIVCAECGEPLKLRNGDVVEDFDGLKEYLTENEETN